MGYNENSQFPKGLFGTTTLSDTAVAVGSGGIKICWILVFGGAAAEVVNLRDTDNTVRMVIPVAIGGYVAIPFGYDATEGLEVITESTAGDVSVYIGYVSL